MTDNEQLDLENYRLEYENHGLRIELCKKDAEIERLTESYAIDSCMRKGCYCSICEKKNSCDECRKCDNCITSAPCKMFRVDIQKFAKTIEKNAKLQKQVDELNKENVRLDKNVKWFQEKIENGELVSEQTVKDTAKEIIHYIDTEIRNYTSDSDFLSFNEDIKYLKERYGVEVE